MAWWLFGSVSSSMIKLKCPHCGEVQMRGKRPARESYSCRACFRLFTGETGRAAAKKRGRKRKTMEDVD